MYYVWYIGPTCVTLYIFTHNFWLKYHKFIKEKIETVKYFIYKQLIQKCYYLMKVKSVAANNIVGFSSVPKNLAAQKNYNNLNMTMREVIASRFCCVEGVLKCYPHETLETIIDRIAQAEVIQCSLQCCKNNTYTQTAGILLVAIWVRRESSWLCNQS